MEEHLQGSCRRSARLDLQPGLDALGAGAPGEDRGLSPELRLGAHDGAHVLLEDRVLLTSEVSIWGSDGHQNGTRLCLYLQPTRSPADCLLSPWGGVSVPGWECQLCGGRLGRLWAVS